MKEFQAIVMAAGRGSRMSEVVKGRFKCTLPIGNKPLLWYPLMFLQKNGFREAIVVVPDTFKDKDIEKVEGLKLDIVTIPMNEDWGTADSLRHIKDKINSDFLVISGDLITDASLHTLADIYRINNASLTILLSSIPDGARSASAPGRKGKHRHERDIIGIEESTNRVVFLNSEADIEEGLTIKTSIIKKHPNIKITTNYTDAHLYLMKKSLLDFLTERPNISTIKGELLPFLLKKQFTKEKKIAIKKDVIENPGLDDYNNLINELSAWSTNLDKSSVITEERITCYSHVLKDGFCYRVNTLSAYAEVNQNASKTLKHFGVVPKIGQTENLKSRVGLDNILGVNVEIGEKVALKNSNLGNNCKIDSKVKLTNSVLMNNACVEEGSSIIGCIICSNSIIGKQCELKDCIVEKDQKVPDNSKLISEVIEDTNELMEI